MPAHPVHAHDRADEPISIVPEHHDPAAVERLLRSLPDWFGIEQAILDYASPPARCRTTSRSLTATSWVFSW